MGRLVLFLWMGRTVQSMNHLLFKKMVLLQAQSCRIEVRGGDRNPDRRDRLDSRSPPLWKHAGPDGF